MGGGRSGGRWREETDKLRKAGWREGAEGQWRDEEGEEGSEWGDGMEGLMGAGLWMEGGRVKD